MLPEAPTLELFKSVPGRDAQIVERLRGVHRNQLSQHDPPEIGRVPADRLSAEQARGVPIAEALDHVANITRCVSNVNRY